MAREAEGRWSGTSSLPFPFDFIWAAGTTSILEFMLSCIVDERLLILSLFARRSQMFALKTFKTAMDDKTTLSKLIDTEIELLKHLSHPNIVSFHELLVHDGDSEQRVTMEYCAGGDLSSLLNKARTSG
jgi:serine/threonine protein kinase